MPVSFPQESPICYFCGGTNIIYGFPADMSAWNGLTKKPRHQVLQKQFVDVCKFPEMFFKVSYMWLELIANNKPQCVHTDFHPEVVEKSIPQPMIGLTSIAQEEMMLLVWIKITIADVYYLKPSKKTEERVTQSI